MSKRLIIVDDHEMVRRGVAVLFDGTEIEVVGEATSGREGVQLARQLEPDIVLLDVRMPDGDGLGALGQIKLTCPTIHVLMYSAYDNPAYIARAVALGAHGYVLKSQPVEVLVNKLRRAAQGETTWERRELRRVTGALAIPSAVSGAEIPMTRVEQEVLARLAGGMTNKEIAQDMSISYEMVKEHVQHLLRKIGVSDRTQAAVWAVRRGLA
jgi:DNA-binding NarL/FixJ family response regulator